MTQMFLYTYYLKCKYVFYSRVYDIKYICKRLKLTSKQNNKQNIIRKYGKGVNWTGDQFHSCYMLCLLWNPNSVNKWSNFYIIFKQSWSLSCSIFERMIHETSIPWLLVQDDFILNLIGCKILARHYSTVCLLVLNVTMEKSEANRTVLLLDDLFFCPDCPKYTSFLKTSKFTRRRLSVDSFCDSFS